MVIRKLIILSSDYKASSCKKDSCPQARIWTTVARRVRNTILARRRINKQESNIIAKILEASQKVSNNLAIRLSYTERGDFNWVGLTKVRLIGRG